MTDSPRSGPAHDATADLVRAAAIALVVLLHAAAPVVVVGAPGQDANWWAANLLDSLARPAVPLFVMLSGMLLLAPGRRESTADHFRHRMHRLGLPAVSWFTIYFLWRALFSRSRQSRLRKCHKASPTCRST